MSDQITTSFIQQYKAGWEELVQQRGSVLRDAVRVEMQEGKSSFYDQIGSVTPRERTTRHGDSPYMPTPHARRQCILKDYDWGDYVDDQDKIRTLNDPTNMYVKASAMAMGRAMDEQIINAFFDVANTGESGGNQESFSDDGGSNVVSSATVSAPAGETAAKGLTVDKLILAKKALDNNEADAGGQYHIACTATQIADLLGETDGRIVSSDYNNVKALVAGEVDTFMGFKFHRVNSNIASTKWGGITMTGTGAGGTGRKIMAWAEDGLLLGIGKNPTARIAERPDKAFSVYVYNSMSIGATRMQGQKCVSIECLEA
jgi:hypothetical protein